MQRRTEYAVVLMSDHVAQRSVILSDGETLSVDETWADRERPKSLAQKLHLMEHCSEIGALVVFEPSAGGDPRLFREALQICGVLKYSDQRARSFSELLYHGDPLLEVETLGEDGLRYRCQLPRGHSRRWRKLGGFEIDNIKDTAGSGNWCTAGLLLCIGKAGTIWCRRFLCGAGRVRPNVRPRSSRAQLPF